MACSGTNYPSSILFPSSHFNICPPHLTHTHTHTHTQVRHKFLQCVTATCFYIAAKLEEKAEVGTLIQMAIVIDPLIDHPSP